ncbi:MAG: fluoride efflux transporter CrcB [Actinomycetota bacterium]|jgi:CrcB protein|nr:fluoride efflux transporter CrcB [Actinomycetota bacterium]
MLASTALAVAAGGFVGAPARYLVDRAVTSRVTSDLPWGTFAINMSGSLLLGLLAGLSLGHRLPAIATSLLAVGFCGAYTTFSTFTYETLVLVEDGRYLEAAANVAASVVTGLAAAAAGLAVGLVR